MDNHITITGRATADAELRFTASGVPVASFTVAMNDRTKGADGQWTDGPASFFDVQVWRGLAENVAAAVTKGKRVMATGAMKQREWTTREGEKRRSWELHAEEVGIALDKWQQQRNDPAPAPRRQEAPRQVPPDPWASAAAPTLDDVPPF